jgi:predicted kinase
MFGFFSKWMVKATASQGHSSSVSSRSASGPPDDAWHTGVVSGRVLYLVGGAPRVGKSFLARGLLEAEGIPWLPTDVVRTVLRRVLPELDAVDRDPVDAAQLADFMYPHIQQAAEVCAEEAERFLVEGFELAPWYPRRLAAALEGTRVRACFLGHGAFSADDLASYRGPKPQHEAEASRAELTETAAWIRKRSHQLREQCREEGLPYVDVGVLGFASAMQQARRHLLNRD